MSLNTPAILLLGVLSAPSLPETPYLSVNLKGARFLVQLNGGDTRDLPSLLDVAAMAADGQAHQIWSHYKLFLERRHQLPGALRTQNINI